MTRRTGYIGSSVILLLSLAALEARAQERLRPLVEQILAAWRTADLVCLGEDHGRKNDSDLRLALVRHPAFASTVSLVVVEFANPAHQALLDRFVMHGAEMTRDQIAVVWRDATGPEVWESPIYEAFLRAIRDLNRPLAPEKRVRVLGGDTSVDWKSIATADQLVPLLKAGLQNRGGNIRRIIGEQVLEKKIKALAIYGSEHCVKVAMGFPGELMDKYPGRMWSVASMFGGTGGQKGRALLHLSDQPAYIVITGTKEASLSADGLVATRPKRTLGDMVDAFVYYGDVPDTVVESDANVLETTYGAELARRRTLMAEAQRLLRQR